MPAFLPQRPLFSFPGRVAGGGERFSPSCRVSPISGGSRGSSSGGSRRTRSTRGAARGCSRRGRPLASPPSPSSCPAGAGSGLCSPRCSPPPTAFPRVCGAASAGGTASKTPSPDFPGSASPRGRSFGREVGASLCRAAPPRPTSPRREITVSGGERAASQAERMACQRPRKAREEGQSRWLPLGAGWLLCANSGGLSALMGFLPCPL